MNPVDSNTVYSIETKHPSLDPIKSFHGRVAKTFSSLPRDGKLFEVIKRIALVVVAPFVYFVLSLVAIIGYPFTNKDKIKGPEPSRQRGGGGVDVSEYTAKNRASSIVRQASDQMRLGLLLQSQNHNIQKIKYLVKCHKEGQEKVFEADIFSEADPIKETHLVEGTKEMMNEIEAWLGNMGVSGEITIRGQAFCLVEDNILHVSWSATDNSTKDTVRFRSTSSTSEPSKEHLIEFINLCFEGWGILIPKDLDDLFGKNKGTDHSNNHHHDPKKCIS